MSEDSKTWWLAVYEKGGLPLLMLGVCGFAFYRGTIWIGENVGRPLINKHVEFLDTTIRQQNALVDTTKEMKQAVIAQSKYIEANQLDIKINQSLIRESIVSSAEQAKSIQDTIKKNIDIYLESNKLDRLEREKMIKSLESIDGKTEKKP